LLSSRSPSPNDRNFKSELDFSDTPRPILLHRQADGPELHDEFVIDTEELSDQIDSIVADTGDVNNIVRNERDFHSFPSDRRADQVESQNNDSSVQEERTEDWFPHPHERECDTTAKIIPEENPSVESGELLIRQRDSADAVMIGSARYLGDNITPDCLSHRRVRSAPRSMASEAQCNAGGWWHDMPERPPAWRWDGDMGIHHGVKHAALQPSSPHSSDSPVLPSASEILYEDAHVASMNNCCDSSLTVAPSRRSPFQNVPPPWAFQGDTSLVIPSSSSAASLSAVGQSVAEAKAAFRGKENRTPPPPMAPSQISSASSATTLAKAPPKAAPLGVETVASLTRSSSTPQKRLPTMSCGASAGLFHKTPSPRPRSHHRTSPSSAPAAPLLLQPRSLLFGSPSPHRYIGALEQDTLDWTSPIRPIRPVRACRGPPPDTHVDGNEQVKGCDTQSAIGQQVDPIGASGSAANCTLAESPVQVNRTPAKVVGSPAGLMGSPARLGLGSSPARTATPVRPYMRSPSATSLLGSPASSCGTRDSGGQRQRSVGGALGSGDTPRNLTDWRKSLQMAKRQEERPSLKKTPWK